MKNETFESESSTNPEIIELAKKPALFCKNFDIPVTVIDNVKLTETGKIKSFEYLGKSHKYVEALAREHYESQGYEASWNEGVAVLFLEHACERALMKRIFRSFKIHSYESYVKINSHLIFNNDLEERTLKKLEAAKLEFDENNLSTYNIIRAIVISLFSNQYWNTSSFATICEDPETTRKYIISECEKLVAQPPSIEEIKKYIMEFMDFQREKYSAPHMKFNLIRYNDWTVNFALRLIEVLGVKPFAYDPRSGNKFPMSVSDLTVLDVQNKELRFVEVKNKDGFTPYQIFCLQQWLSKPAPDRESFELCLVQPSL